jgi:hypothetical protein
MNNAARAAFLFAIQYKQLSLVHAAENVCGLFASRAVTGPHWRRSMHKRREFQPIPHHRL